MGSLASIMELSADTDTDGLIVALRYAAEMDSGVYNCRRNDHLCWVAADLIAHLRTTVESAYAEGYSDGFSAWTATNGIWELDEGWDVSDSKRALGSEEVDDEQLRPPDPLK